MGSFLQVSTHPNEANRRVGGMETGLGKGKVDVMHGQQRPQPIPQAALELGWPFKYALKWDGMAGSLNF